MKIFILITNFIIGCCLGSHALVVTQRLYSSNFIWGSSHCDTCYTKLTLIDEIPIYSYFKNKGKCQFCSASIPVITIIAELYGGFAFSYINFNSVTGFIKAIFSFYFLIISLQDYQKSEFSIIFIIPLTFITILSPLSYYHNFYFLDWLILFLFSLFFLIQILKNKMGAGDFIIFLLLILYLGTIATLHILLIACILFLAYYFTNFKSQQLPFIPFIFSGFIINNLF